MRGSRGLCAEAESEEWMGDVGIGAFCWCFRIDCYIGVCKEILVLRFETVELGDWLANGVYLKADCCCIGDNVMILVFVLKNNAVQNRSRAVNESGVFLEFEPE